MNYDGNPDLENTKLFQKLLINFEFFNNFANKSCHYEILFSVCECTKKWGFFKGLGQSF